MNDAEEGLRRLPSQARGRERVERILDVADALLAEEGIGALSTNGVAARAGISVGSLYHWFPDKESIARALAVRYWNDLADLIDGVAEATDAGALDDPLPDAMDALTAGFRARPGFLALWYSSLRTEELRDATRPVRNRVAFALAQILAVEHPASDAELRLRVAKMLTLLGDGLIREAFRIDREGDPGVLGEGKLVVAAYVRSRLGARR